MRPLDEELLQADARLAEEEDSFGGLAVTTGAADLLVIGLERTGQIVVEHQAHVGAIDAHAEGIGGDDGPATA